MNVGIAGLGHLGKIHLKLLGEIPEYSIKAIYDIDKQVIDSLTYQKDVTVCSNYDELLQLCEVVLIITPTPTHFELASKAIKKGKHVFIEKPATDNPDDTKVLINLAKEAGVIVQIGHVERFNPAFEILQQRVQQPMYIRCQRVSPYTFRSTDIGVVHDLMIHDIDLVLALTGDSVTSVDSFGAVTIGPNEDMAVARLRTSSGVIADITASRMNPTAERTIQVWGRSGFVSADLQTRKVSVWQPNPLLAERPSMVHDIVAATPNPLTLKDEVFTKWINNEQLQGSAADALTAELLDFVHCIRTGSRPRVSGDAAVKAMEVADRVLAGMPKFSWQTGSMPDAVRKAA